MNPAICTAIERQRLLMFGYGGTVRVVEPHLHGVNTAGSEALSAWLRPGWSRQDSEGGWRVYLTDEMSDVQALPDDFASPREGFNPEDPRMSAVCCRVEG